METMTAASIAMGVAAILFLLVVMAMRQRAAQRTCEPGAAPRLAGAGEPAPWPPLSGGERGARASSEERALKVAQILAERRAWEFAMEMAREDARR